MVGVVVVLVTFGWVPSGVSAGLERVYEGFGIPPSGVVGWFDLRTGQASGNQKPGEPGDWKGREAVVPFGLEGDDGRAGARVANARSFDEIVTPIDQARDWRPGERPAYRGSSYQLRAVAALERPSHPFLQRTFEQADFVPFDRLEHFAWCDGPGTAIVGWIGSIEEVRDVPGGWRVRVRVGPKLVRTSSNLTAAGDSWVESYFVDDRGRLIFLGGKPAIGAGRSIFGF